MRLLLAVVLALGAVPLSAAELSEPGLAGGVPVQAPLAVEGVQASLPPLPAAIVPSAGVNVPPALAPAVQRPLVAAMAAPGPSAAKAAAPARTPAPPAAGAESPAARPAAIDEASAAGIGEKLSDVVFDGAKPGAQASLVAAPSAAPAAAGRQLLASLHEQTGRGYREHTYDEAHKYLFGTADQAVVGGQRGVIDAYSGIFVPGTSDDGSQYKERGDQNRDGRVDDKGMNVEHVWPQSFFSKQLPMRSDLHHLMATFIYPNGERGNLPFGEVRGPGDYSNTAGAKRGQGVFEPPDAVKGRVARALLYFYTRYHDRNISNGAFNDAFWNSNLELILRWNRQFPPTDWERARNDRVEKFQGNRNPFVDDPSLADRVGVDGFRRAPALRFDQRARVLKRRRR